MGKEEKAILCCFFCEFYIYRRTCVCDGCVCNAEGVCGYMHVSTPKQTSHGSCVPGLSPDWTFDWAEGCDVTTWKHFDGHEGTRGSQAGQCGIIHPTPLISICTGTPGIVHHSLMKAPCTLSTT